MSSSPVLLNLRQFHDHHRHYFTIPRLDQVGEREIRRKYNYLFTSLRRGFTLLACQLVQSLTNDDIHTINYIIINL